MKLILLKTAIITSLFIERRDRFCPPLSRHREILTEASRPPLTYLRLLAGNFIRYGHGNRAHFMLSSNPC